jgi:hypothetical protein
MSVIFAPMILNSNWQQFQGFLRTPSLFLEKPKDFPFSHFSTDLHLSNKSDFSCIPKNLMLGKRAERFLIFYLNTSKRYRIVFENFQLIENKKTLGEIDFIVQDKHTTEHLHIELSYKFYLFDPQREPKGISQWIGPNKNDSLVQKMEKLKNKQFPLLQHPALRETLESRGIQSDQIKPTACFKAQLFTPFESSFQGFENINPATIRGCYYTWQEFLENQHTAEGYFVPNKKEWLRAPKTQTEWHSLEAVIPEIKSLLSLNKSPLVWSKQSAKTNVFFIVWW